MIFALVNEGASLLGEGVSQRASDIDTVYVNGYGFPVFRGGPMHYADTLGLKTVYEKICAFRDEHGEANWTPAPMLENLTLEAKGFGELA